ncbi:MAG: uracil-DNA glycosylase [Chlamydiota bacterium]
MHHPFLMEASWKEQLQGEFSTDYMSKLADFLREEYATGKTVYPPQEDIFRAFCHCSFPDTSVVIVGQDPYHNPGQAHGLSFSVQEGVRQPPSLQNIFQEITRDLELPMSQTGCLTPWAKQGVLLLNTILTVRKNEPKSHHGQGWERFTDAVIEKLSSRQEPLVFLLWGKSAQEKCERLDTSRHLCLKAAHPSPYSARNGFFGCRHFSQANEFLKKVGKRPIVWQL